MLKQFSKSLLPEGFVSLFGHVLPFLELVTGVLLLLGLFTRFGLILAWLILLSLIVGSSIIQQWNAIFTQLFYVAYLSALYWFMDYNGISVDWKWNLS
jgi:thiosulfate dehydrogenase [quinone] large subunit